MNLPNENSHQVFKSRRVRYARLNHWLTSCKSAELVSRQKILRREPGRDGKILSDHRQDCNNEVHRL